MLSICKIRFSVVFEEQHPRKIPYEVYKPILEKVYFKVIRQPLNRQGLPLSRALGFKPNF
jgi:hypothetical protein